MEISIFNYYQKITSKLEEIEETKASSIEDFNELVFNFDKLIKEIETFLIISYDFHYGYFLLNLHKKYQIRKNFVAGVSYTPSKPILIINPITLGKYTLKEIIFILCHEIEHLVLKHHIFGLQMNSIGDPIKAKKLNIAFDASVNDRLINDIQKGLDLIDVPNNIITSVTLGEMLDRTLEFNQHYLYYYEFVKDYEIDIVDLLINNFNVIYEYNDDTEENEQSNLEKVDEIGQQEGNIDHIETTFKGILDESSNAFDDMSQINDEIIDEDIMENIYDMFIKDTIKSMSNAARGFFTESYEEVIEKINKKPDVNWKKELKKFLGNIPCGYKKTTLRLNRRQPERYDLKGTIQDHSLKIVIAIDTSGSMCSFLLARILNEIDNILKHHKIEITIIECDCEIQKIYNVKKARNIDYKMNGRGGTMFTPVIDYINNNKKYRDALVIFFTDGCGEDTIPKPLVYRMMWIVYGPWAVLSVEEPYGKILHIKGDNYE